MKRARPSGWWWRPPYTPLEKTLLMLIGAYLVLEVLIVGGAFP